MESPPSCQDSQIPGASKHSVNRPLFFCDLLKSLLRQEEKHKANRFQIGLEPGTGDEFIYCLAL